MNIDSDKSLCHMNPTTLKHNCTYININIIAGYNVSTIWTMFTIDFSEIF